MPYRKSLKRKAELSPAQVAYLSGADGADLDEAGRALLDNLNRGYVLLDSETEPAQLWRTHGKHFLLEYVKVRPCKRPIPWWQWGAPEPRRMVGGIGTPVHEVFYRQPDFHRGIPTRWFDAAEVQYYSRKGRFKGVAIDPDDPPRFESEAAYLARHGLLSEAERAHLREHPELLEHETISLE